MKDLTIEEIHNLDLESILDHINEDLEGLTKISEILKVVMIKSPGLSDDATLGFFVNVKEKISLIRRLTDEMVRRLKEINLMTQ